MNISSLSGALGVTPAVPEPEETARVGSATSGQRPDERRGQRPAQAPGASQAAEPDAAPTDLDRLKALTARARLELRIETLPDSDVTFIRIVEPVTGEVVREYPPEGVAKALLELRDLAASRLDRKV